MPFTATNKQQVYSYFELDLHLTWLIIFLMETLVTFSIISSGIQGMLRTNDMLFKMMDYFSQGNSFKF